MTLFAMTHGYLPFMGDKDDLSMDEEQIKENPKDQWNELDHQIVFGKVLYKDTYISKTCQALIEAMLHKFKWQRIKIEKILNHPWLRQMDFPNFTLVVYRPEEIKYIKEEFNFR